MKKLITLVLSISLFSFVANATLYVVPSGTGDGSSWGNAYGDIQTAINAASTLYVNTTVPQEVWVKTGTYSTASAAILMKLGVDVYGGFAGTETDKNQRVKGTNLWDYTNVTTLNGGGAKRCVEAGSANYASVVIIDGFTLTNGNGQGTQLTNTGGGALLRANLKLQNCIVTGNTTTGNGGGVNAAAGIVSNCWIYSNTTTSATIPSAGGIYSAPASGFSTIIEGSLIEKNAQGGVRLQSAGTITMNKTIIRNNTSTGNGAAIYTNNPTNCTITNCIITNNTGVNNIYLNKGKLINSIVANNEGNIYLASATNIAELYNNIVVNNVVKSTTTPTSIGVISGYPAGYVKNNATWPSVSYQTWGGATDSLLTTDVATAVSQVTFVSPTSFVGATADGGLLTEISNADWSLAYNSLCLNFGDNALVPGSITTDFAGNARIVNTTVDAGAYELSYYNTTVTFNEGGTVNALTSGAVLSEPKGKPLAFTITAGSGKQIASVLYNDVEVKTELVEGVYTAPALAANATLVVEFSSTTALNNLNGTLKCFSSDKGIELRGLSAGDEVALFSITGAKIQHNFVVNESMSLPVNKGIYIVKVGDAVKKVVVE